MNGLALADPGLEEDDLPPPSSWAPLDLTAALDGGHEVDPPTVLKRSDGPGLLSAGKLHTVAGETESLKSWLVLIAAAQEVNAGEHVVFVDYEDSAPSVVGRLLALGVPRHRLASGLEQRFHYVRPHEALTREGMHALAPAMRQGPTLAVLDGVTEGMALHGLDPLSNTDVAAWYAAVARPLARTGCAVVMIDHVTKSREERSRWAIGAQHKMAGLDGAAYTVELVRPFGRGLTGMAHVRVAKDRPGRVREHARGTLIADLHLESLPNGDVDHRLAPPPGADTDGPSTFVPTAVMEKVSLALEDHPGLSKNAVRAAVRAKNDVIDLALELLISGGHVTTTPGPRNATHHHATTPYRQAPS